MKTKKRSLLSLLFLIMIFVFSLGVVSCKKGDSGDTTDYAEDGVYYFNTVDDQEYLVTLNDNTFTMWLGSELINGEYTYDGTTLELELVDTEVATATLTDGVLSITYKGNAYRFLKKVNYTVTYNTNGGSDVATATVLNGQTLAKPVDPTMSGYTFIAWYKDAEYKTPFAFGAELVTSNMTLYARFVPEVVGGNEYVATLNLDGATYATQETIGGVLYDLPTPEKAGAQFAGWWVSLDGSETKLSYKYENQTLAASATLYGVWVSETPVVSVNATGASWTVKTAASSYTVKITDPNGDVVYNREIGATNVEYDFASGLAGEYTVEVSVNGNTEKAYYANKTLDQVSLFRVAEPSVLIFNPVENAEKYLIKVVCGNDKHVHNAVDNGLSTNYNFANCEMCPGGIQFQVTAVAKGYANSVSEVFSYSRDLDAVTGLKVDTATDKVVWNAVAGATSYVVEIVKGEVTTKVEVSSTNYALGAYTGALTIKVTPVAKSYNSPEAVAVEYAKPKLVTPSNVVTSLGKLKWTAVEGAVKYVVSFNGNTYETETNELALTKEMYVDGQDAYEVSVKAVAADVANDSAYSETVVVNVSLMNPELSYSKGMVSWSPVVNAYRYEVKVNNGKAISVKGDVTSCAVTLTKAGDNTISVRYYDEDERGSDWVSMKVFAYSITFDACGGKAVATQYKALGDPIELPVSELDGYKFTAWYNVPNGPDNNGAEYAETTFTANGNIILYAYWYYETYTLTLDLEELGQLDVDTYDVGYMREFTLPVPVATDTTYVFGGWYSAPNGQDTQYTNEYGVGLDVWDGMKDTRVYAHWISVLKYTKITDNQGEVGYAVSANTNTIGRVSTIKIPATYTDEAGVAHPIRRIDAEAFKGCTSLEVVQVPDSVTAIVLGTYGLTGTGSAFNGCTNLRSLEVYCINGDHEGQPHPTYYESANGALIFSDPNTAVKELIYVPAALTGIYEIPSGVTALGPQVFYNNKTLQEIKIPATVSFIGSKAFYRTEAKITFIPTEAGEEIVPLTFAEQVFYYSPHKEITLPARIDATSFNVNIFDYCSSLAKISIQPEGDPNYVCAYKTTDNGMLLQALMDSEGAPTNEWKLVFCPKAYQGDVKLPTDIVIVEIGDAAFKNCDSISSVEISMDVKKIGKEAFYDCNQLKTLTIDEFVEDLEIGDKAFYYCSALQNFTIPQGVKSIGMQAFRLCTSLTEMTIPLGVQAIGQEAFWGDDGIKNLTFEDFKADVEGSVGLTIGKGAFKNLDALKTLTIPVRVYVIGEEAFYDCDALETITFDDPANAEKTLEIATKAFYDCDLVTTLTLPTRLKTMAAQAFAGMNALATVTINTTESNALTQPAFVESGVNGKSYVTKVILGKNCPTFSIIGVFGKSVAEVDATTYQNENVTTVNGVMYDKDITEILYFPDAVTEYDLPDTIEFIADGVFAGNALKSITIGYKVHTIGVKAFQDCVSLTEVIFEATPDGVDPVDLKIDEYAFEGCTKLANFTFPDRTIEIGAYAFQDCWAFPANLVIPEGVEKIGNEAFNAANSIETISLPSTLKEIGFRSSNGTSYIGGSIEYFYAFKSNALKSITVHQDNQYYASVGGVLYEKIGIDTITYSDNTTKKVIHQETATTAEGDATATEVSRTTAYVPYKLLQVPLGRAGEIVIPNTVWVIGDYGFNLSSSSALAKVTSVKFSGALDIPEGVEFTIGDNAFYYTKELKTIELPMGLTRVPQKAFYYAQGLETVKIPYTVLEMDERVFYYCNSLKSVIFEEAPAGEDAKYPLTLLDGHTESNGSYGSYYYGVFTNINSKEFTAVTLPTRTVYIGKYAFHGADMSSGGANPNSYLVSVNIPANVTEIGDYAFAYAKSLTTVTFAKNSQLTTIGDDAFYQSALSGEIVIPDTVVSLGDYVAGSGSSAYTSAYTFAYTNITKITLPEALTEIRGYTFNNCAKLQEVVFGDNSEVTRIDESAFYGCKSLTKITLPAGVTEIKTSAFNACTSLTKMAIPAGVTSIGNNAFSGCTSLTEIEWSENCQLETIGNQAFAKTGFTTFAFPLSLYSDSEGNVIEINLTLGASMFSGCQNLETLTFSKSVVDIGTALVGCSSLKRIIVDPSNEHFRADENLPLLYKGVQEQVGVDDNGDPIYEYTYTTLNYSFGVLQGDTFTVTDGVKTIGPNAFAGQAFKKIVLPSSVETISATAFIKCQNLETVVFAEGSKLKTIGDKAFQYCSSLKEIVLPAGLESIGLNAFDFCESLETVVLNETLQSIGDYAFRGTTSLKTVKTPSTLNEDGSFFPAGLVFGKYAFQMSGLTGKVTFPEGMIGFKGDAVGTYSTQGYEFQHCRNITEIVFPSTFQYITIHAFSFCTGLKKVNFPAGLQVPGNFAFKDCTSLESASLPKTLKDIGQGLFQNCISLTKANVPYVDAPNSSAYKLMFSNCPKLTDITIADGIKLGGSKGEEMFANTQITAFDFTKVSMGSETKYPAYMFMDCTKLQSVTFDLNCSIKSLGNYMFAGCTSLKTVELPTALTFLGTFTFTGSGLETISLPAGITVLGTSATAASYSTAVYTFADCVNLKSITFASPITKLAKGIFVNCKSLESIDLSSATQIGNECFMGSGLKSISLPKITNIYQDAFKDCTKLETATFAAKITALGQRAFMGCTSLKSVDFGKAITATTIGAQFFEGCTSLKTVDFLPASLTTMNNARIFYGCTSLESVVIPAKVTSLGYSSAKRMTVGSSSTTYYGMTFDGCTNLSSVTFADASKLKTIGGERVFADCISLKTFDIPANVTLLGYDTFKGSGLTSVTLPQKLTSISVGAFGECYSLSSVTISANHSSWIMDENGYIYTKDGSRLLWVPSNIEGVLDLSALEITRIGGGESTFGTVFGGNDKITRVILPNTLEGIGAYAFYDMQGLLNLEIPASVTDIGSYAFADCTKLRNLTFAEGSAITSLGTAVFQNTYSIGGNDGEYNTTFTLAECEVTDSLYQPIHTSTFENSGFTNIVLPSTVTEFGASAFKGSKITSVVIPARITIIPASTFENCVDLTSVTFAEGSQLTELGNDAFRNTGITEVVLPGTITKIGFRAFAESKLQSFSTETLVEGSTLTITAPSNGSSDVNAPGLDPVGVFHGCTDLVTVNLPEGLTNLTMRLFEGCTSLKELVVPSTVTKYDYYTFALCTALETVVLSENAPVITRGLFYGCTALKNLTLPEGITEISYDAFENCTGLKKLIIPESVETNKLYRRLFAGWNSDQTVYFRKSIVEINTNCNCVSVSTTVKIGTGYTPIDTIFQSTPKPTETTTDTKQDYLGWYATDSNANFVFDYVGD